MINNGANLISNDGSSLVAAGAVKTRPAYKPVVENVSPKKVETKQPETEGKGLMTHEEILG